MEFQNVRRETVCLLVPVAALAGGCGAAWADIVYTPVNAYTPGFFNLDVDGDGHVDIMIECFSESLSVVGSAGVALGSEGSAAALPAGTPIGPGLAMAPTSPDSSTGGHVLYYGFVPKGSEETIYWGEWSDFAPHILGMRFEIGGAMHYGWIELDAYTLYGYAYETTPGMAIPAGAVPSPGTLGGLALGAAGLMLRSMRR